jgi:hypothetical protein
MRSLPGWVSQMPRCNCGSRHIPATRWLLCSSILAAWIMMDVELRGTECRMVSGEQHSHSRCSESGKPAPKDWRGCHARHKMHNCTVAATPTLRIFSLGKSTHSCRKKFQLSRTSQRRVLTDRTPPTVEVGIFRPVCGEGRNSYLFNQASHITF